MAEHWPEARALLLTLLELPAPGLSAVAARELHPEAAALLRARGLLHPDGHEAALSSPAEHDDVPVATMLERLSRPMNFQ